MAWIRWRCCDQIDQPQRRAWRFCLGPIIIVVELARDRDWRHHPQFDTVDVFACDFDVRNRRPQALSSQIRTREKAILSGVYVWDLKRAILADSGHPGSAARSEHQLNKRVSRRAQNDAAHEYDRRAGHVNRNAAALGVRTNFDARRGGGFQRIREVSWRVMNLLGSIGANLRLERDELLPRADTVFARREAADSKIAIRIGGRLRTFSRAVVSRHGGAFHGHVVHASDASGNRTRGRELHRKIVLLIAGLQHDIESAASIARGGHHVAGALCGHRVRSLGNVSDGELAVGARRGRIDRAVVFRAVDQMHLHSRQWRSRDGLRHHAFHARELFIWRRRALRNSQRARHEECGK